MHSFAHDATDKLVRCCEAHMKHDVLSEQEAGSNAAKERMEEAMRQLADLEEAESSEVVYIRGRTTVHSKPSNSLWTQWVRMHNHHTLLPPGPLPSMCLCTQDTTPSLPDHGIRCMHSLTSADCRKFSACMGLRKPMPCQAWHSMS